MMNQANSPHSIPASQVRPGPHWVRTAPDKDWFILDIQVPERLLYGMAQAEYVPIRKPGRDT